MPRMQISFRSIINQRQYETHFQLVKRFNAENAYRTKENLNISVYQSEIWWIIHISSFDQLSSTVTLSTSSNQSHCIRSIGIFHKSHSYNMTNFTYCISEIIVIFGFNFKFTATLRFHSLVDWYFKIILLFWGESEAAEDDTVMQKHAMEALYFADQRFMHGNPFESK